jgi:hypothetical protein
MELFKNEEGVYEMENGMSAADFAALQKKDGFSDNPLLWLITLGAFGQDGFFGSGGRNGNEQAFAAIRDNIQGVSSTLLAN